MTEHSAYAFQTIHTDVIFFTSEIFKDRGLEVLQPRAASSQGEYGQNQAQTARTTSGSPTFHGWKVQYI